MRAIRIGLTGPIGCGKTTVAAMLRDLGLAVIDADVVARGVVEPGTPAFEAVVEAFGRQLVGDDGSLDRAALGRIVFADPVQLRRLEAIVHPEVRIRILDGMLAADRAGAPGIAVEAIKLVEGGLGTLCDEIWLVACEPGAQRRRLAERGLDAASMDQRIAVQADPGTRLRDAASRVIDTSGSLGSVRDAVERGWMEAVRAAVERAAGPDL